MRKRDVRWSARVGLSAVLMYGGAQLACSSGDDSSGDAVDGGSGDATAVAPDGGASGPHDAAADAADADMCFPSAATAGVSNPTFTAPGSAACSSEQLTAVFAACFAGTSSDRACSVLQGTAGYEGCFRCISGGSNQSLLAPLLSTPLADKTSYGWFNTGGCIAALEPSEHDCAVASAMADTCEYNACTGCTQADEVPVPSDPYGVLDECVNAASDGGCASLQAAETTCWNRLLATDAGAAACLTTVYGPDQMWGPPFFAYLSLVCGPPDGGVGVGPGDAGDAGDADARDASDAGDADAGDGGD